jgi:hypothetical protein
MPDTGFFLFMLPFAMPDIERDNSLAMETPSVLHFSLKACAISGGTETFT